METAIKLNREDKRVVLAEARTDDIAGDPWGTTMCHLFGVLDPLAHHASHAIPSSFNYRHAPGCDGECLEQYPSDIYHRFIDAGEFGIEMLTYAARVLDRYSRILEKAGRSY